MSAYDDALLAKAAEAIFDTYGQWDQLRSERIARVVLDTVAPLIAAQALREAATWIASIGYPVQVCMPDLPLPADLWNALVDVVHEDATGEWHGNTLDREEVDGWLRSEAIVPVSDHCDCAELCAMGPTCPAASPDLPGAGCWRVNPATAPGDAQDGPRDASGGGMGLGDRESENGAVRGTERDEGDE